MRKKNQKYEKKIKKSETKKNTKIKISPIFSLTLYLFLIFLR